MSRLFVRPEAACFNGATTLTSWKTPSTIVRPGALTSLQWGHDFDVVEDDFRLDGSGFVYKLQWGHDFDVVEDAKDQLGIVETMTASMGPRL